jgi:ferredoxin
MLVIFLVACVAGVGTLVQLLAPYSAFGRIATMLLQPVYVACNNLLASIAEHYESYAFYSVEVWMKSLPVFIIALATLIILAVLAWRNGRTYCNTICPVGTVLSFLARFSWMKIHFDENKCKNCSQCTKNCKAACIDFKNHKVDYSRCVVCGDCIESCKFGALKYSWASCKSSTTSKTSTTSDTSKPTSESIDPSKRSFLIATTLASTAALAQEAKNVDGGLADIIEKNAPERNTPVTPPGSLSAKNMATRCTGCQLCVSECPNDVLRPSTDLLSLMQPTMSFERGFCRPECTRCSEVCPAGAIKPIDDIEKSCIQIGHAMVAAEFCISALGETECGNCARHCPVGAIEMIPSDPDDELSPSVPAVNENACIGCGACEYLCPVRPLSAIHVEGHEVHKMV